MYNRRDDPVVRPERTHWRDQSLSERHRLWGYNAPAVDIDFLLIEYDSDQPRACIEYKAVHGQRIQTETSALRAVTALCNSAGIPFFLVAYHPTLFWVWIKAMNVRAQPYIPTARYLSEVQFVTLLYRLRNRVVPQSILSRCNTVRPMGGQS